MGIEAAIIGSAVVGGIASDRAASKANKASRKAAQRQIDENARQYDQTREDFSPYRQAGVDALGQITGDNVIDNFYASPDYEFRRDEGMRDLGNQFAVRGGGGNAMKALNERNSNLASGEFGNWFERVMGLVDVGSGATRATSAAGENRANRNNAAYAQRGMDQGNIAYNKYAGFSDAAQSGISNMLYQRGKPIAEIPASAYAPKQRTY